MKAVPRLTLEDLSGAWHEIARLPGSAQRADDRQIQLTLIPLPHHQLTLQTTCLQANGTRREVTDLMRRAFPIEEPGQFQRFTGPAWLRWMNSSWLDYWVLAFDARASSLMIGEPERQALWIYSREPTMERSTLEALKTQARRLGYDLAPLLISGTLRSFQPL